MLGAGREAARWRHKFCPLAVAGTEKKIGDHTADDRPCEAEQQGGDPTQYEDRWVNVTRSNLDLAYTQDAGGTGRVIRGDARHLADALPDDLHGRVALVVTSPPYGASTHGQVSTIPGQGVHKTNYRYGSSLDRHNLANLGHRRLLSGFTAILTSCLSFLQPGGHVAITIRPWREYGELVDLPAQILVCGVNAGLVPVERCVALLARIAEDDQLVARGSFFQRDFIRKQRDAGLPAHLIAHEDVLVFQAPKADEVAARTAAKQAA